MVKNRSMKNSSTLYERAVHERASVGDYCGTREVAGMLGLSVAMVQSMVEKNELEAWKTRGGHRRISIASVNRYLQQHRPAGAATWPAQI